MAAEPSAECVVIGAGALGLGFLGPELSATHRVTYLDIPAKADLLHHLRGQGSYIYNQTGLSMRAVEVTNVTGHCLGAEHGGGPVGRAFEGAEFAVTAVGEPNLHRLAPTLAEVALGRTAERPLRVLCAENGVEIAHNLRAAIEQAAGQDLSDRLRVGDTVMGRMCKVVEEPEPPIRPVAPGLEWAVVAEPYHGIPVERSAVAGLSGLPPAVRPQDEAAFGASEDVKMLAHNGLHAVLACVGRLRGAEYFDELREDAEVMEVGRRLLVEEAGPALLSKHGEALDRNRYYNYADWILRRVTCPVLHDPLERGTRGIMRKLQPWERLVYSALTVRNQGGRPEAFAQGLAAAVIIARRTGQTDTAFPRVLTDFCGFAPEEDAGLIERITEKARRLGAEV